MAERRMFTKAVVESDKFLDMPASAQVLYFHLGMEADDEGFVIAPKRVMRSVGAAEDDMRLLIAKGYVLAFESGVILVTHWKQNNYLQRDRIKASSCTAERELVAVLDDKSYALTDTQDVPLIVEPVPEIEKPKAKRFVKPTVEQIQEYITEKGYSVNAQRFFDYYESKGWVVGKSPMKDWKASVRGWESRDKQNRPASKQMSGVSYVGMF